MSLALNKPKLDNLAGNIWTSAERLRISHSSKARTVRPTVPVFSSHAGASPDFGIREADEHE